MSGKRKRQSQQVEAVEAAIEEESEQIEYTSHRQQLAESRPSADRVAGLETALLAAFQNVVSYEQVAFIQFGDLNAFELAQAFEAYPMIVKCVTSCVNVAQRSIERDLAISLDTYAKKVDREIALALAGYLKPLLPQRIALPALMELDRFWWTDKEMRASKGRWEKAILDSINLSSDLIFKKRKFKVGREEFEIDAAYPAKGDAIQYAIDVKRIESPRDIHKRSDEIINKAVKFKDIFPNGRFFAVIYYPFPNQHINVQSRLHDKNIDGLFFAAQSPSSVAAAVDLLVGTMGLKKKN